MKITRLEESGDIWKLNNIIVDDWFSSNTRQILSCNGKTYIYKKDIIQLYEVSFHKALKIMIQLDNLMQNQHHEY